MPELKNTFTGGRMEKDLDERIVPNGLYREALNIGVSTSEDSDVGAAQNILGNIKVTEAIQGPSRIYDNCTYAISSSAGPRYLGTNYHIISTVDPQTDMIYRFVATVPNTNSSDANYNPHGVWMDRIVEYDTTKSITDPWNVKEKSVFVDIYKVNTTIKQLNPAGAESKTGCNKTRISVCNNAFQLREGMVIDGLEDKVVYIEIISYGSTTNTETTITLSENIDALLTTGESITFVADRVLNFHPDRSITGLNIIDGLIFWTDNYSEPKKINIKRSKLGSNSHLYGAGYQFDTSATVINLPTSYGCSGGGSCHSDFEMHTKLIINDTPAADCDKDSEACETLGCIDSLASNYDPTANVDDGSCEYPEPIQGCTDPTACNYDPLATVDCAGIEDGSVGFGLDISCCNIPGECEECDGDNVIASTSSTCLGDYDCFPAGFDNDSCDTTINIQGPNYLDTNGVTWYQNSYSDSIAEIYKGRNGSWRAYEEDLSLYHFWVYQNSATYTDGSGGPGVGHLKSFIPDGTFVSALGVGDGWSPVTRAYQTCIDLNPATGNHRFKSQIDRIELWEIDKAHTDEWTYAFDGVNGTLPTTWDLLIKEWDMSSNTIEDVITNLRAATDPTGSKLGSGWGFNGVKTDYNDDGHYQRSTGIVGNTPMPDGTETFNALQNELMNGLMVPAPLAGPLVTNPVTGNLEPGPPLARFHQHYFDNTINQNHQIQSEDTNIKFFLNIVTKPCECEDDEPQIYDGADEPWAVNFRANSECIEGTGDMTESECQLTDCYTNSPLQWNNLRDITDLKNPSPLKQYFSAWISTFFNEQAMLDGQPYEPQTIVNPIRGGGNIEHNFTHLCRPVYVQEKHVTVIRKGPTAPPKLQMYKWEDDADIEDLSTGVTKDDKIIVQTSFSGKEMPQKQNWDTNITATPTIPNANITSGVGTGVDGSDVSIFYTPTKELLSADDEIILPIDILNPINSTGAGGGQGFIDWTSNDKLLITHSFTDTNGNTISPTCRVQIIDPIFDGWDSNNYGYTGGLIYNTNLGPYNTPGGVLCKVLQISKDFPVTGTKNIHEYTVKKELPPPLFETKFPKFAYRYKYEDGEYSVFGPWSEIAFMPGKFDYLPKKGYNLGMVNTMRSLKILDWNPKNRPKDVVEIDILYKESNSPNVYTVKTFKSNDVEWAKYGTGANQGVVAIQSELIHKTVPSNQMLRPWDNVPRIALGQEITANRLIFANYVQNYNMIDEFGLEAKPIFSASVNTNIVAFDDETHFQYPDRKQPLKSLKSMRNYQIGVVYRDRYGRETPVLTDPSGSIEVPKKDAKFQNRLQVKMLSNPPAWAESFTFYIKETSNEYYNLAMDRWYNADDDGIWLSFPSSERNKLSERSILLLKKQHDSDVAVDSDVKYKVIDIKNDAPTFIKTENRFWGALPMMLPPPGWGVDGKAGNWDTGMFHLTGLPLPNRLYIDVYAEYFDQSVLSELMNQSSAQIRVVQSSGQNSSYNAAASQSVNKSNWYDISTISYIGSPSETYEEEVRDPSGATITKQIEIPGQAEQIVRITLENIMGTDMAFCEPTDNLSLSRGLALEARTSIVRDKSQFQGRFFVKILRDAEVQAHIVQSGQSSEDHWQILMSRDVKYIAMAHPGVQDWMTGKSGTAGAGKGKWYGNRNENGTQTLRNYLPIGKLWATGTGTLDDSKYEVSSYHPMAGDATYRGVNTTNNTTPLKSPPTNQSYFWPMGPGYRSNPALDSGWYYNRWFDFIDLNIASDYYDCYQTTVAAGGSAAVSTCDDLFAFVGSPPYISGDTDSIWPDISENFHNWPSFYLNQWVPATCRDCTVLSNNDYPGGDGESLLDLSLAEINQDLPPFNDIKAGNPMYVPAIWGDQSDLLGYTLSGGTKTNVPATNTSFGAASRNYDSEWKTDTIEKLRSGFYYLYYGRDKVDDEWPLGKFEPERWFIDKCGSAKNYSGAGIWETQIGGAIVSRMDLSFYGIGSVNTSQRDHNMSVEQPNAVAFGELMATVGTQFRFQQDPNETVYTVTEAKLSGTDYGVIYNYEGQHGSWGYFDEDAGTIKGGGALGGSGVGPPWGSNNIGTNSIAGKAAFFSDLFNPSRELTGGAPYNYRQRITITLNKEIGTEGPMINSRGGFHPIKNHVDKDGNCNIKGGPKRYSSEGPSGGWKAESGTFPEEMGGIPNHEKYFNLSSYWNYTGGGGSAPTGGQSSDGGVGGGDQNGQHFGLHERGLNSTTIEIITPYKGDEGDKLMSNDPAIWETEPMEDVGLDIYYAASPSYPINLDKIKNDEGKPDPTDIDSEGNLTNAHYADYNWRGEEIVSVGAEVKVTANSPLFGAINATSGAYVTGVQGNMIWVDNPLIIDPSNNNTLQNGHILRFFWNGEGHYYGAKVDNQFVEIEVEQGYFYNQFKIKSNSHLGVLRSLSYFNCYSFSNGVESNRIRDDYNAVTIDKGVKASMPLAEGYEQERRASSLIFSGIYNSTSGVNRTNQFIQAEPITKDLNPINGSIQKLFARDTDLVTFCENKVFKILAKKDALFNADGNTNVTSNAAVLGQAIPFTGEYGISTNPESFASQSYRVYFSDRSRGSILRLSRDGLTPISDNGMKDWFKDNLWNANKIIGSYDDRKEQYNVTLETEDQDGNEKAYTLSWVEDKKGWVSFKSFIQQDGLSHKNIYYTFASNKYSEKENPQKDPWGINYGSGINLSEMWQHNLDIRFTRSVTVASSGTINVSVNNSNDNVIVAGMNAVGNGIPIDTIVSEVSCNGGECEMSLSNITWLEEGQVINFSIARNNFYNNQHYSMVKTLFNKDQGNVKRFKTLNYEGSQSKVIPPGYQPDVTNNFTLYNWQGGIYSNDSIQIMRDNYAKEGWYAHSLLTDLQKGSVKEFVNKEHKWFDYIRGKEEAGVGDFLDTGDFSLQGLGVPDDTPPTSGGVGNENLTQPAIASQSSFCNEVNNTTYGGVISGSGPGQLQLSPMVGAIDLPYTFEVKNIDTGVIYQHSHGQNPNPGSANPNAPKTTSYGPYISGTTLVFTGAGVPLPGGNYEWTKTTASGCTETTAITMPEVPVGYFE